VYLWGYHHSHRGDSTGRRPVALPSLYFSIDIEMARRGGLSTQGCYSLAESTGSSLPTRDAERVIEGIRGSGGGVF